MREFRTYGSVRGAHANGRSYRDQSLLVFAVDAGGGGAVLTTIWNRDPPCGTEEPETEIDPKRGRRCFFS